MDWIGLGWDLCVGLLYEHRFAVLIIPPKDVSEIQKKKFLAQANEHDTGAFLWRAGVHILVAIGSWLFFFNNYDDVNNKHLHQGKW